MNAREQSVGRAVAQFALTGAVAVLLLGLAAAQALRTTSTWEAITDAERVTRLAADGIVAPFVTPAALMGDREALEALDRVVRTRLLRDPVVRVKLWTASGRIVYSDEPRLIGRRFQLDDEDLWALRGPHSDAEVSDLAEPENRFEREHGRLLEVYRGVRATNGTPLLFESYLRFSSVAAGSRRVWRRFAPAVAAALVLLWVVQIPLAYLLARRLRDRQRERSALLQRAVDASERERRLIAGALHDGPVQQLAGVAYSLAAASARLRDGQHDGAEVRATIDAAAARTRGTMRDLRTMLVDLYPPTLHREGLHAAVVDLLSRLEAEGLQSTCEIPASLALPAPTEALLFRAAREALQNVHKHANATRVDVGVRVEDGLAVLEVSDDGVGFEAGPVLDNQGGTHIGLRLVSDLARDAGGRLRVDSVPGRGTRVRMEVRVG